ncbi:3-hydroxyanthranilate 3,4-dioxygenase [Batrachochytrium salamandrivorans]|nr:3-hydroxyanthranilate 3,4-dioxygenase [Batrachochytrium salamandrivorans]
MLALPPTDLLGWIRANKEAFAPPICNKLLHRGQRLSIMLVGGPNQRKDFHSEEGSEFFYQLEGNAEIVTLQAGRQVSVPLGPGELFLLPSRVPHSPQRSAGSMGLVIERNRLPGELDSLTWYADSNGTIEFQRYFECRDLGKDLVPIVSEYREFLVRGSQGHGGNGVSIQQPLHVPSTNAVPMPVNLPPIGHGRSQRVFGNVHPDKEFLITLELHGEQTLSCPDWEDSEEAFLYQLEGSAVLRLGGAQVVLNQGECCVVVISRRQPVHISRPGSSNRGLVVMLENITGNKCKL